MSRIKEVATLFKYREAKLLPITGKTTDDNLECLRKILSNLLHVIKLPEGTNAKGIIATEADYKAAHASLTFDCLDTPLQAYNPLISSDDKTTGRMQAEREWMDKLLRQRLLQAAKRGARILITGAVKDTWLRLLKNTTTYYNKSPPQYITNHLVVNSGGIEYIKSWPSNRPCIIGRGRTHVCLSTSTALSTVRKSWQACHSLFRTNGSQPLQ